MAETTAVAACRREGIVAEVGAVDEAGTPIGRQFVGLAIAPWRAPVLLLVLSRNFNVP
jgi:hypothetical protein